MSVQLSGEAHPIGRVGRRFLDQRTKRPLTCHHQGGLGDTASDDLQGLQHPVDPLVLGQRRGEDDLRTVRTVAPWAEDLGVDTGFDDPDLFIGKTVEQQVIPCRVDHAQQQVGAPCGFQCLLVRWHPVQGW